MFRMPFDNSVVSFTGTSDDDDDDPGQEQTARTTPRVCLAPQDPEPGPSISLDHHEPEPSRGLHMPTLE